MYHWNVQLKNPLCAASCVTKNISPRFSRTISYRDANSVILQAHLCITVASMRKQTAVEIVHEESFLHAEPVKPPPPLHLRLPAAVAELAVYVFREHHAGAVLLFCVPTLPFLAKFGTYCCLPNTNTTERNIRHIYDWSKCAVFDTLEPKLTQHTD